MEKFSKLKVDKYKNFTDESEKDNIVYKDEYMSIIKSDDWNIIKEKDIIVCIPYLIEENRFILRKEYIPAYKYVDGQEYHIALVGGQIDKGEDPETAILRELQEEAGIVLRDNFEISIDKPLFISKGHASKYYTCIITLTENDYHEIMVNDPDNTFNKKNGKPSNIAVKVDIKYINSIVCSDLITQYMIDKFKQYLNL